MAATKIAPTRAGIHGSLAMVPLGGKVGPESGSELEAALNKLLGSEIEGPEGTRFRLVRLNSSALAGTSNADTQADPPGRRTMKYSTAQAWDVEPTTAATDRPCGITVTNQVTLADNDFLWVQIEGMAEAYQGDDATNTTAGDFVGPDDDADKGKVISTTTTFTYGVTVGRALETQNGNDVAIEIMILYKMVG